VGICWGNRGDLPGQWQLACVAGVALTLPEQRGTAVEVTPWVARGVGEVLSRPYIASALSPRCLVLFIASEYHSRTLSAR